MREHPRYPDPSAVLPVCVDLTHARPDLAESLGLVEILDQHARWNA